MIEWTTVIVTLISSAIGAGAITSLVTMKEKKKGKQLENKEKEEDVKEKSDARGERLADQLEAQIGKLNEQITDLNARLEKKDELLEEKNDIISDLKERLDKTRSKYIASDACRCIRISCAEREPSGGSRMLDVDRIVAESEK